MRRRSWPCLGLVLASTVAAWHSMILPAFATGTVSVALFRPEAFYRDSGSPVPMVRTFTVLADQGAFTLKVQNGSGAGDNAVSAAVIKVNGATVVRTSDLSQQVNSLERPLSGLVKGTNTIEVEVRSIPSSCVTVSVVGEYLLDVTITSPLSPTTVFSDKATVKGVFSAYTSDVGITVNGIPAALLGGTFVAEDVPLLSGANTISGVITTFEGIRDQDVRTLMATGERPPLSLLANLVSGAAPLSVSFRPQAEGIRPVEYRYDFDGDGTVDLTAATEEAVAFTYVGPGTYPARVTAVDDAGNLSQAEKIVVMQDPLAADALLSGRWYAMASSLEFQDIGSALSALNPESRATYEGIFTLLSAELPGIFASVSSPELIQVRGNVAQYRVRREQLWDGVVRTITYYVWFVKDGDGLWRIDQF